ncbi:MAG: hypothetical protein COA71_12915 [SAR86 cluster bacterium]|uniref:Uncharacterized protein n=1 Tax=SAR86 cluster bacterium TaxID=2030880 RepID=A0A2A5C7I9_9GAMM|nr:MAG: hypothetical protein COA71_12915 [SAR86 cluster bacterium]
MLMATSFSVNAHHSVSGAFLADDSFLETLSGTISKTRWENPHIPFNLDIENEDGIMISLYRSNYDSGAIT